MKPIIGYCHMFLNNLGYKIATELIEKICSSGLYAESKFIKVVLVGPKKTAAWFAQSISENEKFVPFFVKESASEWCTMKEIVADTANFDADIFYCHTKGSTSCRDDVPLYIQRNIIDWRNKMIESVIDNWKQNVTLLEKHSSVGPYYVDHPPHYAGNFWWATTQHIKSLKEIGVNRNDAEFWIGSGLPLQPLFKSPCEDLYGFIGSRNNA